MSDLILILGAVLVAAGIGLIFMPAGLIAGGLLAMAGVIFYERGPVDSTENRPRSL